MRKDKPLATTYPMGAIDMATHKHRCGHRTDLSTALGGPTPNIPGCGFVWEHEDIEISMLFSESERPKGRHNCPNCNIGPWSAEYTGPLPAYPAPPRVAMGRVVRPADGENTAYVPKHMMKQFVRDAVEDWALQNALRNFFEGEVTDELDLDKLLKENPDGIEVVVIDLENRSVSGFKMGEVQRKGR